MSFFFFCKILGKARKLQLTYLARPLIEELVKDDCLQSQNRGLYIGLPDKIWSAKLNLNQSKKLQVFLKYVQIVSWDILLLKTYSSLLDITSISGYPVFSCTENLPCLWKAKRLLTLSHVLPSINYSKNNTQQVTSKNVRKISYMSISIMLKMEKEAINGCNPLFDSFELCQWPFWFISWINIVFHFL